MSDLWHNLRTVLRSILFLRLDANPYRASTEQVLLAMGLGLAAPLGLYAWQVWPVGGIDVYGVNAVLAQMMLGLAALAVGVSVVGRGALLAPLAVAANLASVTGLAAATILWLVSPEDGSAALAVAAVAVAILPVVTAVVRLFAAAGPRGGWRALPTLGLMVAAIASGAVLPADWPFYPATDAEDEATYTPVDVEGLYLAQPALMDAAVAALRPGTPGTPDLFALLVAGTAHQGVFLSEVEKTAALLADRHGAKSRILTLANSTAAPLRHPMANRHNLAAAMQALAGRMNPEDIALVFLTSHGKEDRFSLSFHEAGTADLGAAEFAGMIEASGLRNAVVVISACHSGSFVDELAAPDRLVLTASATETNSFGCSDKAEWTWFGSAFVDHGLRETADFRLAFAQARDLIETWEGAAGHTPSRPQMSMGTRMDAALDGWLAGFPAERAAN